MPETTTKAELLTNIQAGYHRLEALLAPLNEQQLTSPIVATPQRRKFVRS